MAGTPVTFTAAPVNGGTVPAFQWKVNAANAANATNATYTYTPANGDVITCVLTSNAPCVTGRRSPVPQTYHHTPSLPLRKTNRLADLRSKG